jgi:hypothetical protein
VLLLWARALMNGFITRVVRGGISLARGRFFVVVVTPELCISINALLRYQGFPFPITICFRRRQSHLSPALCPLILLLRCCKCAFVRIFAFVCVCSSGVDADANDRVLFLCFFFSFAGSVE